MREDPPIVTPAKAGVQSIAARACRPWIPACAGMTKYRSKPNLLMPEFEWQFTLVLLTNGVMIGLMYALIALGFVLIYKATDAINFAQGEFVMFAGLYRRGRYRSRRCSMLVIGTALDRRHDGARIRTRAGRVAAR